MPLLPNFWVDWECKHVIRATDTHTRLVVAIARVCSVTIPSRKLRAKQQVTSIHCFIISPTRVNGRKPGLAAEDAAAVISLCCRVTTSNLAAILWRTQQNRTIQCCSIATKSFGQLLASFNPMQVLTVRRRRHGGRVFRRGIGCILVEKPLEPLEQSRKPFESCLATSVLKLSLVSALF